MADHRDRHVLAELAIYTRSSRRFVRSGIASIEFTK